MVEKEKESKFVLRVGWDGGMSCELEVCLLVVLQTPIVYFAFAKDRTKCHIIHFITPSL